MAMSIENGQEMKMTIRSASISGTKNKTIRYLDPLETNTTNKSVTNLAKDLMSLSTDSYAQTTGAIELGILDE